MTAAEQARMHLRALGPAGLALVLATSGLAACFEAEGDGSDASGSLWGTDVTSGGSDLGATDSALVAWPPAVDEATEGFVATAQGATYSLFGGELEVTLVPDTFTVDTPLEVTRRLVDVFGVELVGYVWGDHGKPMPLAKRGKIAVLARLEWLPVASGDIEDAGLYLVVDGGLDPLAASTARPEGTLALLEADLEELGTIVIAAEPLPAP